MLVERLGKLSRREKPNFSLNTNITKMSHMLGSQWLIWLLLLSWVKTASGS